MELIDGADLAVIRRKLVQLQKQGRLNWKQAVAIACGDESSINDDINSDDVDSPLRDIQSVVEIVRQVATAVECLHEAGIVHRDIKPGNIMIVAGSDRAVLMDLGLAGLIDEQETRLTRTGLIAGTLPYVCPEQFLGEQASQAGDIYNLGAVLWELITLHRLFDAGKKSSDAEVINRILKEDPKSLRDYRPEVSVDLEAVVLKCLEKQPANRYASVADLIVDLDRVQAGRPVTAERRGTAYRTRRWFQRHRKPVLWVVGLAVCQGVLVMAFFLRNSNTSSRPAHFIAAVPTRSNAAARVINDSSLVAYWSAEGTGSTASDGSSNGNNGALTGDTSRDQGAVGNAFSFDGDGDYITFGRSTKWNFLHDGSPFTIAGFVAPAAGNLDGGILTTIDETSTAKNRHGLSLRLDGAAKLKFHIQGAGGKFPVGAKTETALPPDEWTAFAVTFDGQTAQLFVKGRLAATGETVCIFCRQHGARCFEYGLHWHDQWPEWSAVFSFRRTDRRSADLQPST